jgi:hypothetical protein
MAGMRGHMKKLAALAALCAAFTAFWACSGAINLIAEVRDEILRTTDTTPPDPIDVTSCAYSAAAGGIQVGWTAPAEQVLVLRSTAGITDQPAQGVSYGVGAAVGAGTVAYAGNAASFVDTGAGEGLMYYRAFAVDAARNYAAGGTQDSDTGYIGVIFASITSGSPANMGFSTAPKASIQAAITTANSLGIPRVNVAEGTYSGLGPVVTLVEGVSIYGGYHDMDWGTRAPSTYVTTIKDTTTANGASITAPHHAVLAGSSITSATIVDGFTIAGATLLSESGTIYQSGLWINGGAPTIQNNTLDGGEAAASALTISTAVCVVGSSPVIQNNRIITGKTATNYGLYLSASSAIIGNNSIDGSYQNSNNAYGIMSTGSGSPLIYNNTIFNLYSYYTYAIRLNGGAAEIYNNYIHAGNSSNSAYGIYNENGSTPAIINNIFRGQSSPGYGIYEDMAVLGKPTAVQNNDFFSLSNPGAYYRRGTTYYRTISALQDIFSGLPFYGIACSGNAEDTPTLDSAYRLIAGTPLSIYAGGLNLGGEGFSTDKDGATRNAPWSMGAYEYNP